jgi:hypothetical protein
MSVFLMLLCTYYSFPETCGIHEGDKKCTKITVKISQGKKPLRRHTGRWENNIKTDLKEMEGVAVD